MSRELADPEPGEAPKRRRKVVHETPMIGEGDYDVFTRGPDTILKVGNGELAMSPDMARNISVWFRDSGERVRVKYFPDMTLKFMIANLTDATEQESTRQQRRDATAKFA